MQSNAGLESTFVRAWQLLVANWIIVVPGVVVGIVTGAALYLLAVSGAAGLGFYGNLDATGIGAFYSFMATLVAFGVRIFGAILAIAYTTGMAGAAWRTGKTSFADGADAFRRDGAQILLAMALLFVIGIIAAFFVIPTFFLSVLLYMIFAFYTMPSVVVGERPATVAIVESVRIAAKNLWTTILVVVLTVVVAVIGGVIGDLVGAIPFLGSIVQLVIMETVVAYAMLVLVGEYIHLRPTLDEQPPNAAPGS